MSRYRLTRNLYFNLIILQILQIGANLRTAASDSTSMLKSCRDYNNGHLPIEIPSQYIDRLGNITYIMTTHRLQKSTTPTCDSEGYPSVPVSTASLSNYRKVARFELGLARDLDHFKPKPVQLSLTLLQENGYLTVGRSGQYADYYNPDQYCVDGTNGQGDDLVVNLKTCPPHKESLILPKCCPIGTARNVRGSCVSVPKLSSWYTDIFDAATLKPFPANKKVKLAYRYKELECIIKHTFVEDDCTAEFHPLSNNKIVYVGPHRNWEYLDPRLDYCFENIIRDGQITRAILHCEEVAVISSRDLNVNLARPAYGTNIPEDMGDDPEGGDKEIRLDASWYIYPVSMCIGAFFNLLTTLVYLLTWRKQNIHKRTLCFCTLALFLMQVCLGAAHILGFLGKGVGTIPCIINAICGQYFMISAFTWLLVVNIDLWWTFRTIRQISNQDMRRFWFYSGFGWGFPFVFTGISIILNFTFTCITSRVVIPEYGVTTCFISRQSRGYYLYYMLCVLILLSFVFSGITFSKLFILRKSGSHLEKKSNEDKQTVILFLKLGVVMGLCWVFEVISWATTKETEDIHILWKLIDIYTNALSAILIFIIFVCKRATLNLLEETYPPLKRLFSSITKIKSNITGDSSTDTTEMIRSTSRDKLDLQEFPRNENQTLSAAGSSNNYGSSKNN